MGALLRLPKRSPRYTAGIAAEAFMEVTAHIRPVRSFIEDELRRSWQAGLVDSRMRELQSVMASVGTIETLGLQHAGWADAACADGKATPGHGEAA